MYIVVELIQPGVALQAPVQRGRLHHRHRRRRRRRRREAAVSTSPKRNYIYPAGQAGRRAGRYTCTIKMVDINKWTGGYQEGKSHPVLVKRDWILRYLMMPQPIAVVVAAAAIAEYLPGLAQLVHSIVL